MDTAVCTGSWAGSSEQPTAPPKVLQCMPNPPWSKLDHIIKRVFMANWCVSLGCINSTSTHEEPHTTGSKCTGIKTRRHTVCFCIHNDTQHASQQLVSCNTTPCLFGRWPCLLTAHVFMPIHTQGRYPINDAGTSHSIVGTIGNYTS